ncbi:MAG: universal stress protein [Minicystis sp.]
MSFTQKIVAPTDFSPASALALDAAALLARQFGAEVHLLYVYDPALLSPLYVVPGAAALSPPSQEPREFEDGVIRELQRVRDERLAGLGKVELAVKQHASAAEGIVEHARDVSADSDRARDARADGAVPSADRERRGTGGAACALPSADDAIEGEVAIAGRPVPAA